jgi:membrane dipeptidase
VKLIFDAHLDLAWNALGWGRNLVLELAEINACEAGMTDHASRGRSTTSLPEMRRGGVAVCLATIIARAKSESQPTDGHQRRSIDYPTQEIAYAAGQGQLAYYRWLEREGELSMIRTANDLTCHWQRWQQDPASKVPVGVVLSMEGADPIVRPPQVQAWWDQGLRTVSLAHYGRSVYAVGTGASGPLTEEGILLLAEFDRVGMILDVTHLAEPGFSQALDLFAGPVMASHNNCRALVPGDRQFADEQLRRLIQRDAVIGVALDAWMLHPEWQIGETSRHLVSIQAVADHIDHICQTAGNAKHAGIGSDLDGGYGTEQTPVGLETIADLQKLVDILAERGYPGRDIDAVFYSNWLRFFVQHLPQD